MDWIGALTRSELTSDSINQLFVIGVRANEEPDDHVALPPTNRAIPLADPRRPDVRMWRELLKLQTRMVRIGFEELIRLLRLTLDFGWQRGKVPAEAPCDS